VKPPSRAASISSPNTPTPQPISTPGCFDPVYAEKTPPMSTPPRKWARLSPPNHSSLRPARQGDRQERSGKQQARRARRNGMGSRRLSSGLP
jgi:hypothetical protein